MHELDRAIEIALEAHAGQNDKTGEPYFLHCNRVAAAVSTIAEKTVAYLHDVVEKSEGRSIERLKVEGFSDLIVSAVDALTKREDENEEDFVRRAARLARPVTEADLKDNLDQAEASGLDPAKYVEGLKTLSETGSAEPAHNRHVQDADRTSDGQGGLTE
ncbi:HD domain-containing protein [Rhizobium sp. Root1204]|uniref:HD domain-containing protein n=1 Tax=Rhizobium sp. Root1204 TaxID=1736428 RepID=UPI0009EBAFF4|nr:HD domain-containing protein [Rhizobium sp. Root1204]